MATERYALSLHVFILCASVVASPASANARPSADVVIELPASSKLGEPIEGARVTFDNSAAGDVIGYGPFIDLVIDATGADGAGAEEDDGVAFLGASHLGSTLTTYTFTFPEHFSGVGCVAHPLARDTDMTAYQVCGQSGDTLVVIELPYGSFVTTQPAAVVDLNLAISDRADTTTPHVVHARGGYQFGLTPLDDPCCDPTLLDPESSDSSAWSSASTLPTLLETRAVYVGPEDETATGPNFPRRYNLIVDVADGQTTTDNLLTATLPETMAFSRVVSMPAGATIVETPPTGVAAGSSQRTASISIPSITGTAASSDAVVVIEVFIPRDDGEGDRVLDPPTGDDTASPFELSVIGTWSPLDPRDASTPGNATSNEPGFEHTLTNKAVAVQEGVSIVADLRGQGCTPGDTLEYTLDFQVSDYFSLENLDLSATIPDGVRYDPSFPPTFEVVRDGSGTTDTFDPSHFSVTPNYSPAVSSGADGTTGIWFDVSGQLSALGLDPVLRGGCVPIIGTVSVDCDLYNGGPTTGRVTFRAIVQEDFSDTFPSGDASVDAGDRLTANVTINADIVDNEFFQSTMYSEADTSTARATIGRGSLDFSIFAINGVAPATDNPEVQPGDEVTYRIRYSLPTADVEDFQFDLYLPLPVFSISEMSTSFQGTVSTMSPDVGESKYGPSETFVTRSGAPDVSIDAASNSIHFDYGDVDDTSSMPAIADILVTSRVTTEPFADELRLTAHARASQGSTNSGSAVFDALDQIVLRQPVVRIQKGVTDTSNPNATINPGGHFDGSTPLSSSGLASAPNNGALTNIDAGETVDFAITLENVGGADAYDLIIKDAMPPGMKIPSSGLDLSVKQGDGATLAYRGLGPGVSDHDIFANGIEIIEASESICQTYDPSSGKNVVIVTYTLEVSDSAAIPAAILANTATLTRYTNEDGAGSDKNHVGDEREHTSTATATIATPDITHTLISTSEPHTSGAQATIGEELRYTVSLALPEGVSPASTARIVLPPELEALRIDAVTGDNAISSSAGSFAAIAGAATISADARTITLDFGTLTNSDRADAADESITITYTARVDDVAASAGGDTTSSVATWSWSGGSVSRAASANLVEPVLKITKETDASNPDEGDAVTYTVRIEHDATSTADAFRVNLSDAIPAGLLYVQGTLASTGPNAPDTIALSGADITASWDSFPRGSVGEFEYTVTIPTQTSASTTFSQDTDASWESLDAGAPSRTGDDSSGATFSTSSPSFTHSITGTSVPETDTARFNRSRQDVAPGEVITYTLTATFPEGLTPDALFTIDTANSNSEGYIDVIDATVTRVGSNLILERDAVPVISDSDSDGAADLIRIDFGDVSNPEDGSVTDADRLVITYTGRVRAHERNTNGKNARSRARLSYSSGSTITRTARVDVVRPITTPLKTMSAPRDDLVTITVGALNSGGSIAHEIELSDDLDETIWDTTTLDLVDVPAGFTVSTASANGTTTLRINADQNATSPANTLEPGERVDVVFNLKMLPTSRSLDTITNTLTVQKSTSLAGESAHESNDVGARATATLLLPKPSMHKRVEISENIDGLAEAAPGDALRYTIEILNSGPGALTNVDLTDVLDADTTIVADSVRTSPGATIVDGTEASDALTNVRFASIGGGQTAWVSFDVTVGTPASEELSNQASMTFDEFPVTILSDDLSVPGVSDPVVTPIPLADAPTLDVTSSASTDEDLAVALDISAGLVDLDGSETLQIEIAGVPVGATLSAGTRSEGRWVIAPEEISGLTLTPAPHSDEDLSLLVTARATESSNLHSATTTETIDVSVNAVADTPSLSVADVNAIELIPTELPITTTLIDRDGSEIPSVYITGAPEGTEYSAGAPSDMGWLVTGDELEYLRIAPPVGADFTLSITASATESANGDSASVSDSLLVQVSPKVSRETRAANHFQVFVPPNNDRTARYSAIVVTAMAGSADDPCVVDLIDDDADGDGDDSVIGASLTKGQSVVQYIKDGTYNDDFFDTTNPGANTWDGDYFIVDATKPVNVQIVTDSDWQHDWVPSDNGTLRGNTFFLFSNDDNRDVNVIAYDDDTRVSVHEISTSALAGSGITSVGAKGPALLRLDLDRGEDAAIRNGSGDKLLSRGRTYMVTATKPITVLHGALVGSRVRDGGGFVPGVNGSTTSNEFYFNIPHDPGREAEQELRVVAASDDVTTTLSGWSDEGNTWELIQTDTLDRLEHLDYVGGDHTLFRLETNSEDQLVSVFEANWLETGAIGTSDIMSFASALYEADNSANFMVYLGPPGIETNTATGDVLSHVYISSKEALTGVVIQDAHSAGAIFSRTVDVPANGIVDIQIDRATYAALDQSSAGVRPYLNIKSPGHVSVAMSNWNDNWMAYATSVDLRDPDVTIRAPETLSQGQPDVLKGQVTNLGETELSNTTLSVELPAGVAVLRASYDGIDANTIREGEGMTEVIFELGTLEARDAITFTIEVELEPEGGTPGELLSFDAVVAGDRDTDRVGATAAAVTEIIGTNGATLRALSATPRERLVELEWVANVPTGQTASIELQRSTAPTGPFTTLYNTTHAGTGSATVLSYTDTSAENEITYYYRVLGSIEAVSIGALGPVAALPRDITPPPQPTLTVVEEEGEIISRASGSDVPDLAGYHIERREPGAGWSRITSIAISREEFIDRNVSVNTLYDYRVYAIDDTGNRSEYSMIVSASPLVYENRTTDRILKFEDMIGPDQNDWDYNDLIIRVIATESYDSSGGLEVLTVEYEPLARGAGYIHQLRQAIPIDGAWTATLTHYDAKNPTVALDSWSFDGVGSDLDIEIFEDTRVALPLLEKQYANTDPAQASWEIARTARLVVVIDDPGSNPTMATAGPWDLYIRLPYLDEPNEVHRASWAGPTEALMSPDSVGASNLPGGLTSIPPAFQGTTLDFVIEHDMDAIEPVSWAFEGVYIWVPYPIFISHTMFGGDGYADWYLYPTDPDCVFTRAYQAGQCAP